MPERAIQSTRVILQQTQAALHLVREGCVTAAQSIVKAEQNIQESQRLLATLKQFQERIAAQSNDPTIPSTVHR